ncbi:hypothetical protein N7475_001964 [Penicillium sp. IBT 31633x]|nr:hypothetical protein N7475_001964 [Penicillium sp. IBT 31633x]
MFKKICHTVKCFGRRGCKCDDDTDHPVQPVALHRTTVKRLQRQAMPKGMHRAKAPTKNKNAAAAENLVTPAVPTGGESGDDGENEDNEAVERDTEMAEDDTDSQGEDQELQEEGDELQDEGNETQDEVDASQEEVTESQAEENRVEDEDHEMEDQYSDAEEEYNEAKEEDSEMEEQFEEPVEGDEADGNDSAPSVPSGEEDNGHDHSADDDDGYPPSSPSFEAGGDSHDENSDGEEVYPPLPPSSASEDSGNDENSDEEQTYPPLPSSHGSSHTGSTSEVSKHNSSEGSSSSDDEFHSLPSAKVSRTSLVPKRKSNSDDENSSSEDFYSLRSNYSHTGITPDLSETGFGNRPPSSQNSSRVWTSGESDRPYVTHAEYVTSSSQSAYAEYATSSSQSGDSDMPHVTHAEHAAPSPGGSEPSRGRRRWRPVDDHFLAELERGLYDIRDDATNSIGSKRARFYWPSSSGEQAAQLRMHEYGPVADEIAAYRARGAQYQAWIDNPNEPGCPIPSSTYDMNQIFTPHIEEPLWQVVNDDYRQEPVQLGGGDPDSMNMARGQGVQYRYTHYVLPPHDDETEGSSYIHYTARGIIIGDSIFRHNGPHWSDFAAAIYEDNYRMNTLRHIVYTDVANVQTGPYIRYVLYPNILNIPWDQATLYECARFQHGTPQYQELLGTALGRSAAALVLARFPRGTMRISQIVTWCDSTAPQIRFQLEPVIDMPAALPSAA